MGDGEAIGFCAGPSKTLMRGMHLLPFSPSQREQYIEAFARKEHMLHGWTPQQFRDALGRFPHLEEFLQEPLLLYLVLNVLPLLSSHGVGSRGGMRLSRMFLEVFSIDARDDVTRTQAMQTRQILTCSPCSSGRSCTACLCMHGWYARPTSVGGWMQ